MRSAARAAYDNLEAIRVVASTRLDGNTVALIEKMLHDLVGFTSTYENVAETAVPSDTETMSQVNVDDDTQVNNG